MMMFDEDGDDDKMSFSRTYNSFGSTNDTPIKCKSLGQS